MHVLDYFSDMAAILNSLVSNNYDGMLREESHTNLPPEHFLLQVVETTEFKVTAALPKRSIDDYYYYENGNRTAVVSWYHPVFFQQKLITCIYD